MKYLIWAAAAASLSFTLGCQPNEPHPELLARLDRIDGELKNLKKAQPAAARQRPRRPDPSQVYKVNVRDGDAFRGGKHAKVTIVEAYEFACPYCAQIESTLTQLLDHYSDEDLKVVSKQFVVHPQIATDAALATCAAGRQNSFARYTEELWKDAWRENAQPRFAKEVLKKDALVALAKKLGLNADRFAKDLDSSDCRQKLQRDQSELSRLGVRGTPTLYINGRPYQGSRAIPTMKAYIDAEIKKADAALAKGTKLQNYYASVISKGKASL